MHNAKCTDTERSNPTGKNDSIFKKKLKVFVLNLFIHIISDSEFSVLTYISTS